MIRVTLSANAGVAIEVGGHRIWVDAVHESYGPGFSTLTPQLQKQMLTCEYFFAPEYICVTHVHGDHYSRKLTQAAKEMWPDAKLCLPEQDFDDQVLLTGEEYRIQEKDITLRFLRLPHEGTKYPDMIHYSLLITSGGKNVFVSGDCAIAHPKLEAALAGIPIYAAILDFPWMTKKQGRQYVLETMRPEHVLCCHLPFESEDTNGYRLSARRTAEQYRDILDLRLLMEPMQTEIL